MEKFYKDCSSFLVKNKVICKNDKELYEYAIKVFIQGFISILITCLIALFAGMLKECFYIFSTFIFLRKFTGGLHAKKYFVCLIGSTTLIILSLYIVSLLESNFYYPIFIVSLLISMINIWIFSPIKNKNKSINKKERKIYKTISIILTIIILISTLILSKENSVIKYTFGIGEILVSVLISVSVFMDRKSFFVKHTGK